MQTRAAVLWGVGEDWQVEDPKGQPLPVVREIVADVEARVLDLLARVLA